MNETFALSAVALAALAALVPAVRQRLELSLAKHPSLTGHSRMAKRVARLVPGYRYDEDRFFGSDGAPAEVQQRRRAGSGSIGGDCRGRALARLGQRSTLLASGRVLLRRGGEKILFFR